MSNDVLRDLFSELFNDKQNKQVALPAKIGDDNNNVEVPDQPNMIYVQVLGRVATVFCKKVSPELGIDVWVGHDPLQPEFPQVLSEISGRNKYGEDDETSYHVPPHHRSHEYPSQDTVFVQTRQIMPLRVSVVSGEMKLHVYRHVVYVGGEYRFIESQEIDISIYEIFADKGTKAKYILIEVSSVGEINVVDGTEVDFADLGFSDIPDATNGAIRLAAVRIWSGQKEAVEARTQVDIIDLRFSMLPVEGGLTNPVDFIIFNPDYISTGTETQGATFWDDDNHCLTTIYEWGTSYQHGFELYVFGTDEGNDFPQGSAVSVKGVAGNRVAFELTDASSTSTNCPSYIGLITSDVDSGNRMVTREGSVHGLDTSLFSEGDCLWVDPNNAGDWTNAQPNAPDTSIRIGIVVVSHATEGEIVLNRMVLPRIGSLSDVNGTAPVDNSVLVYDAANEYWNADDTPALNGENITGIPTSGVEIETLNITPNKTVQDYLNTIQSSGYYAGGEFTDNGDGTVTIAAGVGAIRATNTFGAQIEAFQWSTDTAVTLVDNSTNYIYASYNSGTPIIASSITKPTDYRTNVLIGKIYREGTELHLFKAGMYIPELAGNVLMRFVSQFGEATRTSGGAISETGTRNIKSTAALLWGGLSKLTTAGYDTSVSGTFEYYYYNGTDWIKSDETQIDNLQYNDITSGLSTVANNRYGIHWVYVDIDGHMIVVYGQDSYTLINAESAQPPASLPNHIVEFAFLAAKIIVYKNATAFTEIQSAYDISFTSSVSGEHNELAGLQGGTVDEYFHLTSVQHALITSYKNIRYNWFTL